MEVVVAQSRYYPDICLEGLKKTTKTSLQIADVPAEIQTEDLPNLTVERCV
jgi:hypothetical protein